VGIPVGAAGEGDGVGEGDDDVGVGPEEGIMIATVKAPKKYQKFHP